MTHEKPISVTSVITLMHKHISCRHTRWHIQAKRHTFLHFRTHEPKDQCRVAYDYRERPYLIILISLELWFAKFSVSFSGDRHATCYCFSFNKHASNCWQKLSFRQFDSECHRYNYTIVEGGNLRMNLTLSLTKILKIVWEKWPSRWNATQSDQIMCHTGAGWTF